MTFSRKHRSKKNKNKAKFTSHPVEITIESLGAGGDGVGHDDQGRLIYIPYSLPNEAVKGMTIAKRGEGLAAQLTEVLKPSDDRVPPKCSHFGTCGGCSMQHMDEAALAKWKRDTLISSFGKKGLINFPVNECESIPSTSRRRARFAVMPTSNKCIFGFNSPFTRTIVDIDHCPLLTPKLMDAVPTLRDLCGKIEAFAKGGDLQVTETLNGLDILFAPNSNNDLSLSDRENLIDFANSNDVARISWESDGWVEPVAALHETNVKFAHTNVAIPIGAFLQPSQAGQDTLVKLVCDAVGDAKKIADFYCGCGSFTLPLANLPQKPIVHASDGIEDQVTAMRKAVAGQRITVEAEDLAQNPPTTEDLNYYEAVVFDPPRAGAQRLAQNLASSTVPLIVAVSCNPATLTRDLRILVDGGYRIIEATPVDQFAWSAHLEAVVVLKRVDEDQEEETSGWADDDDDDYGSF